MDWKKCVDVSPSLLFEDIADSDQTDAGADHKTHAGDAIAGRDDQDAESCSCDASDGTPGFDDHDEVLDCDEQDSGASNGSDHGDDHYVQSTSSCFSDVALGCLSREEGEDHEETNIGEISKGDPSEKSQKTEMIKDEMEDRLFWETCMAVGYPS